MTRSNRFAGLGSVPTEDAPQPPAPTGHDWSRLEAMQVRLPRRLKREYQAVVFEAGDSVRSITQEEYTAALVQLAVDDPALRERVLEQARTFRRERLE